MRCLLNLPSRPSWASLFPFRFVRLPAKSCFSFCRLFLFIWRLKDHFKNLSKKLSERCERGARPIVKTIFYVNLDGLFFLLSIRFMKKLKNKLKNVSILFPIQFAAFVMTPAEVSGCGTLSP